MFATRYGGLVPFHKGAQVIIKRADKKRCCAVVAGLEFYGFPGMAFRAVLGGNNRADISSLVQPGVDVFFAGAVALNAGHARPGVF